MRRLPPDFRLVLGPGLRRIDDGAVLVGGSPLRVLRLNDAGVRAMDHLASGAPVGTGSAEQTLARRLLDAGIANPVPPTSGPLSPDEVTVVVPVKDDAAGLAHTLAAVEAEGARQIVVVDDGSSVLVRTVVRTIRHPVPRGPGAARNSGWRAAATPLVAFVDAGCEPSPEWLDVLLPHFADPAVAAVAPRITAVGDAALPRAFAVFDAERGPLDRGTRPAIVRPQSPVPYVPTTAIVVRRDALLAMGGFDESLRFGEDVDLVWRLGSAGHTVRYEPAATATEATRATPAAWARQRFDYGTSAAPLARRHGRAVTPLRISPWSLAAWALVLLRRPWAGTAVAAVSTGLLIKRLRFLDRPVTEAVRLAGGGNLRVGQYVAEALRRSWWPPAVLTGLVWPRSRRGLVAAFTLPALAEWARRKPQVDPLRWVALSIADDVCYGAGVWAGSIRERSTRALTPDLVSWPGRPQAARPSSDTNETISPG